MIGQEHIRRLDAGPGGSRVVAVAGADAERAATVAAQLPAAKALPSGEELIVSDAVDAVVVTSWGPTHEPYVLACIAAGKPVFCEKPLATTEAACRRDRKSTRLNSSHANISYAVFCLKKKKKKHITKYNT